MHGGEWEAAEQADFYDDGTSARYSEQYGGSEHARGEADGWSDANHEGDYDPAAHEAHYGAGEGHTGYHEDHGGGEEMQGYAAPPLTPDLWAEQGDPQHGQGDAHGTEPEASSRAPRRPLVVLASVLVLTGGGLAATFLARAGVNSPAHSGAAPTIMAAAGPNKIKLAAPSDSTPEDADSALLSKNGASGNGPAKVVNSQEQPIDLNQLPKAASSPGQSSVDAAPTGSASPFPEPKKVKTFLVRPDGTMITPTSGPTASAPGNAQVAARPAPAQPQAVSEGAENVASVAPRPSTPKTSTRVATTPKAPPASIEELASAAGADAANAPSKAVQAASPGANGAQGKPKPIEVADASTSDAPTGTTGAFGLQLAAAPSEQDARSIFSRLQKKYSGELGSFKPTIRKAESGDKSVYRVRVGNLSQDQAKSLCARLQSSGGPCFVVHN